jgi:hypothetical protein
LIVGVPLLSIPAGAISNPTDLQGMRQQGQGGAGEAAVPGTGQHQDDAVLDLEAAKAEAKANRQNARAIIERLVRSHPTQAIAIVRAVMDGVREGNPIGALAPEEVSDAASTARSTLTQMGYTVSDAFWTTLLRAASGIDRDSTDDPPLTPPPSPPGGSPGSTPTPPPGGPGGIIRVIEAQILTDIVVSQDTRPASPI